MKKKCVGMLLAGGQGSRLGVLTKNVAKPAVLFGGKYRLEVQVLIIWAFQNLPIQDQVFMVLRPIATYRSL